MEQTAAQPLGRHIENLGTSQDTILQNPQDLFVSHAAVDGCRLDAQLAKMVHLVLHECDEWRDDHADSFLRQCRNLKGDALATTRRHQPQCVVTGADGLDDFALDAAKIIIAPILFQYQLIIDN